MRRSLSTAVIGVLVLAATAVIAGCGSSGGSGGTATTSGDSSEISGKVTVWDFAYHSFPGWTKAANILDHEFEHLHPGVTVERVAQPFANYEALAQAAFTAHEGPDVMSMQAGNNGVLHFKEGLEVLNDRIPPELLEQLVGWEWVTPGLTSEGDHYGVPVGFTGAMLYYNKALFAKAGLPREFKPDSWSEVLAAAKKLQAAGIQPFSGGNKEGLENAIWLNYGWQSLNTPEQATELAEGELPYTSPTVTKAFGPQFEMQEAGFFPDDLYTTSRFTEGLQGFGEGEAAMAFGYLTTTGYWGEYDESLGEKNVGMIFPPGSEDVSISPGIVWSIPTFAKNKDAAWAFVEFLASAKSIETLVELAGELPNRKDMPIPASFPSQPREVLEKVQSGDYTRNVEVMLPGSVVNGPMATEVNQALQGRTSLEAAQEAMQETAEKTSE